MYTNQKLCQKIQLLYPEIGRCDIDMEIHKPPASIRFAPIKHALAATVEPFKFSTAVAYELSQLGPGKNVWTVEFKKGDHHNLSRDRLYTSS